METDITKVSQPIAQLVQIGLAAKGYYDGTTMGIPATKTVAAFNNYKRDLQLAFIRKSDDNPTVGEVILELAKSHLGVREEGANTGHWVKIFQAATWLPGTGWAWCAAFVCWCVREAFARLEITDIKRPLTAAAWDFINWAKPGGRAKSSRVKLYQDDDIPELLLPGDIIIFTFSHIAINEKDMGKTFKTVEGNTNAAGSREGDGVYQKDRADHQVRAVIRIT